MNVNAAQIEALEMPVQTTRSNLPPMLQQYLEFKSRYTDCLLLFQVGDFYEAFFDDARALARTLNVTLTSRDKNSPDPIPMAGVPIAVIDSYVARLVQAGQSVAIVSQVANPTAKGTFERRLERIITPAIQLSGENVDSQGDQIVAALFLERPFNQAVGQNEFAIAFGNVASGKMSVRLGTHAEQIEAELLRINPRELILPQSIDGQVLDRRLQWIRSLEHRLGQTKCKFRTLATGAESRNCSAVSGYNVLSPSAKKAVQLLVSYVDEITVDVQLPITEISLESYQGVVGLDATTRRNLDLVRNGRDGRKEGSLFSVLDRCRSAAGSRLLRHWILNPITDLPALQARHSALELLLARPGVREDLSTCLKCMTDFERIAARLELDLVNPAELATLRQAFETLPQIRSALAEIGGSDSGLLTQLSANLTFDAELLQVLQKTLSSNPPANSRLAGIIQPGFNAELDQLRVLRQNGKSWLVDLETKEKDLTGISSLKIKHNNIIGYFFETTKANSARVPDRYIRKQGTTTADRFITEELKELEDQVVHAEDKQLALEADLYAALKAKLRPGSVAMRGLGAQLATLDVLLSLAEVAEREGYVRPVLDDSHTLEIEAGRHPVIASLLEGRFIPNSTSMDAERYFAIITGANMGGKSTYLRQSALIVLLAQIGSFVPAKSARIGIVDKIFARLGASDDLLEGESTFMVEMREAAYIVAQASSRSLLLIDEIGRGTATTDGLALAQAILEWIVFQLKARTFFATHFHELTVLAELSPAIYNLSVGSFERAGEVVFTHEIKLGAADRSYGLEVARLAGLPKQLLSRAQALLTELGAAEDQSAEQAAREAVRTKAQLDIFNATQSSGSKASFTRRQSLVEGSFGSASQNITAVEIPETPAAPAELPVEVRSVLEQLRTLDINNQTPLAALNLLQDLSTQIKKSARLD